MTNSEKRCETFPNGTCVCYCEGKNCQQTDYPLPKDFPTPNPKTPEGWWDEENKKMKFKSIDHRSGTIDGSSQSYDEMRDYIEILLNETRQRTLREAEEAVKGMEKVKIWVHSNPDFRNEAYKEGVKNGAYQFKEKALEAIKKMKPE